MISLPEPWHDNLLLGEKRLWMAAQRGSQLISFLPQRAEISPLEQAEMIERLYSYYAEETEEEIDEKIDSKAVFEELPRIGAEWGEERTIRSEFLTFLIQEGFFKEGLLIEGAKILNPLRWEDLGLREGRINFCFCYFEDAIHLSDTEAPALSINFPSCAGHPKRFALSVSSSRLKELRSVKLQISKVEIKEVSLEGDFSLAKFRIEGVRKENSLIKEVETVGIVDIDEAQITGALHAERLRASKLSLRGAQIEHGGMWL